MNFELVAIKKGITTLMPSMKDITVWFVYYDIDKKRKIKTFKTKNLAEKFVNNMLNSKGVK